MHGGYSYQESGAGSLDHSDWHWQAAGQRRREYLAVTAIARPATAVETAQGRAMGSGCKPAATVAMLVGAAPTASGDRSPATDRLLRDNAAGWTKAAEVGT
jgi:hypothetical protein